MICGNICFDGRNTSLPITSVNITQYYDSGRSKGTDPISIIYVSYSSGAAIGIDNCDDGHAGV